MNETNPKTSSATESADETADRFYKDDAGDFGQSSDIAQRGRTPSYAGGGTTEGSGPMTDTGHGQGNNAGSQEDWQDPGKGAPPKP